MKRKFRLIGWILLTLYLVVQVKLFLLQQSLLVVSDSTTKSAPIAAPIKEYQRDPAKKNVYDVLPTVNQTICANLPIGKPTSRIWKSLESVLLDSLRHPKDIQNVHVPWIRDLLQLLNPSRLEQTILSTAETLHSHTIHPSVWDKFARHVAFLENPKLPVPPTIKILVFGGSIVEGVGCQRSPVPGGKLDYDSLQECAWPFRWQRVLNRLLSHLFGVSTSTHAWVTVHNLAAGGTHSEAAIPILHYWLSPVIPPDGADVIINAYSANDNLPPAYHATTNTTMDEYHYMRILKRNMEFVTACRDMHQGHSSGKEDACMPSTSTLHSPRSPWIIYVNDYLGNQQESIVGEGQLEDAIQWVADLEPSLGYVSVPFGTVRHWVLANTTEDFFSAPWKDRKGRTTVNVHYGVAGHVTTTIALTYYFLRELVGFCETPVVATPNSAIANNKYPEGLVSIDIPSKEWVLQQEDSVAQGLLVPNISEESWRKLASKGETRSCSEAISNISVQRMNLSPPCAFSFLAAPLGTHQRQDLLATYLSQYTLRQDNGWSVQNDLRQGGFQNKLGLVASDPHAAMTLSVPVSNDISSGPIRVITIQYLKSYGDLWQGSTVQFAFQILDSGQSVIHKETFVLEGHHDQEVSISYYAKWMLGKEVPLGGSLRLTMTLVSGKRFKINAMMFCSR